MKLEPLKLDEEKELLYSNRDETEELGCIGHLRGDFGSDGKEFWTTWFPHLCDGLNDDGFKDIFDAVINKLREPGSVLCTGQICIPATAASLTVRYSILMEKDGAFVFLHGIMRFILGVCRIVETIISMCTATTRKY